MRQRHHQAAPLLQRGLAAQRQGRHSEAVAALRRAATLQPGNGAT
jgi:Flp pilus assembly protein TadD